MRLIQTMVHTDPTPSAAPGGQFVLEPPPELPRTQPANPMSRVLPLAMIVAMAGMSAVYLTSGGSRSPMFLFFPAMMAVSLIGTLAYGSRGAGRGAEINAQRAEYLRYLDSVHAALAESADAQHRRLHGVHPDPTALWALACSDRLWERGAEHPDFLAVRVGLGNATSATTVVAPPMRPDVADPVVTEAVRDLVHRRALIGGVPVLLRLADIRVLSLAGDPAAVQSVARALVCQLTTLHGPDSISVAALLDASGSARWDWLKWLPHARGAGPVRHRVIVVDGNAEPPPEPGCTVVALHGTEPGAAPTVCGDDTVYDVVVDTLSPVQAVACARRIAAGAAKTQVRRNATQAPDWPALMGIDDPASADPDRVWRTCLAAPVGLTEDGSVLRLDINEAAAGGMGPHGLCVGATGSGKSEFLRTLTLGMIAGHSPEALNLVLIDFKGGATFLGMDKAQHVSAVITNLADEAPLVARMRDALSGELNRRQEVLRAAGNVTNIGDYRRMRARDPALPALPALFIVVDEFSELLSQHPDFIDVFVAIGRLGRSLGIHLLLASQRLDEGRLRGLETHLSYRICLKTFSAAESRAVLGVADAYHLPSEPGAAYLKTADGRLSRFQTAFVSGPYRSVPRPDRPAGVRRFTLAQAVAATREVRVDPAPETQPLLEVVLRALGGRGPAAHRIWLPPLHRAPPLPTLLAGATDGHLQVPIGVVDCPFEQRYGSLLVDLSGSAGHVAIVGAPRSGKSTALLTLVTALAATHDTAAVQFYCLDFGGGALSALTDLPHVGSVATRADADLCRRTVAVLESLLRVRESAMRRLRVSSFAEYRDVKDADPDAEDPYGEVFLVVDGWAAVRQEFDALGTAIAGLAAQGLAYGVHVVLSAARWADFRPALKDQIGTRIELRLGDPADSEMDRRRAREFGDGPPGRGLTREGKEMLLALPDFTGVRTRRDGRRAKPVEVLPVRVPQHQIVQPGHVVLGLGERDLAPVTVDFLRHPHLLILGEGECGKTSVLRLLCTELMRTAAAAQAQIDIVDYRRTLLGVVETTHLAGYSVSGPALAARITALSAQLSARMPDEHVSQRQLRDRSWWDGPDVYVIVDDYDLVAGATGNPLTPLADFLPHAKDLGLHLVVARRSGGAARAMFDPVLARMRDMGCAGLMMSASPDEGVLLGSSRPTPQPPGRGTLQVRGRPDELVQLGWVPPP